MEDVRFCYGKFEDYVALKKDANTLYFTTDSYQIFRGEHEYTKSLQAGDTLPQNKEAKQGIIYVRLSDMSTQFYSGREYKRINRGYATKIPEVVSSTDDNTVPTTKAVADYVTAKLQNVGEIQGVFVTDVQQSKESGELVKFKGGSGTGMQLTGVAHDPTWDAERRIITIPTQGGSALEINLGKDSVVTDGRYDGTTKEIILTLSSGGEVKIPVGSLIDIYVGLATSTTDTTVDDQNQIKVNVKVSAKANNQIVIEDDGLYVPFPDAYTKAEVDSKINTLTNKVDVHIDDETIHITDAERQTWNAKVGQGDLASAETRIITAASKDAQSKANDALASAQTYANNLNTSMGNRVSVIENALTWQVIPASQN